MKIFGRIVDIFNSDIYSAEIDFFNGIIRSIKKSRSDSNLYIMPGLIDSHVHIESSMVTPGAFAVSAVKHGTIGVVSDPHEIANVLGIEGVNFMIEDSKKVPLYFWFGAPSCVPATRFETTGSALGPSEIRGLLERRDIKYLSEMMNYPGVIFKDKEVIDKIEIAKELRKPIDGHAPGLKGEELVKYINAGISTDHECSTLEEALEKIMLGMNILIREGSAARNLEALEELYNLYPDVLMLCSDDIHPEMLEKRHINKLVSRLIKNGYNIFDVIRSCTINPVNHYGLDAGMLRMGDSADFIIIDDLNEMNVKETWIKGEKIFADGKTMFSYKKGAPINKFNCSAIEEEDLWVKRTGTKLRVISASDGELMTSEYIAKAGKNEYMAADPKADILKIVVKDRYNNKPPAIGFIKGFGLGMGALASSVAHDSHNIICVGTDDKSIADCINEIVRLKGGLAVASGEEISSLQLNIGGIMSDNSCSNVAASYKDLTEKAKMLGCSLSAPFMTLSFMALLVIPELKLSDMGLFDSKRFTFTSLFVD
jgi:adenine deaminase